MAEGKKITDIVAPEDIKQSDSGVSSDNKEEIKATASAISKHSSGANIGTDTNNPTQAVSTNAETQGADEPKKMVSKNGINIQPLSDVKAAEESRADQPSVSENPVKPQEPIPAKDEPPKETSDFVSQPATVEDPVNTDPEPPVKSRGPYEASDSLPDENDKKTTEATDGMQNPKIYDTKEYFVPIKNSTHSHGHLGTAIAGVVAAAVVMAVVAFAALNFF